MNTIDARGRACPEPVMLTRKALKDDSDGVMVLVDDICAVENITRFASHMGFNTEREDQNGEYKLTLTKK